jgi:hypothetical protein
LATESPALIRAGQAQAWSASVLATDVDVRRKRHVIEEGRYAEQIILSSTNAISARRASKSISSSWRAFLAAAGFERICNVASAGRPQER